MKQAIICDLDGTLALLDGRHPYDPETVANDRLNEVVALILKRVDKPTFFVSGRFEKYRQETEDWLKKHKIKYKALFMRANEDHGKDTDLKQYFYHQFFKGKYEVIFVLDDRNRVVKMWRDLGLVCLQVAEGDF